MGIFTAKLETLDDLLLDQLQDLYDAENRLVTALPKMAEGASAPQLKQALKSHLEETKAQVQRLERAFEVLDQSPKAKTCEAMKGLIKEGEEVLSAKGDAGVKDAAIIAAAQRVEHYEIAGYGSARSFAQRCGHQAVADLLQQTLEEEGNADQKLTQIAEAAINPKAAHSS